MNVKDEVKPSCLLEEKIGYKFKNETFLTGALTHSSYANEMKVKNKKGKYKSNECLEFLGDSVLSLVVSEHLYGIYADSDEGVMTRCRAKLVCEESLNGFAQKIDLGSYMLLGNGEIHTHGRTRKSMLADAFEALIAAIFLDSGMDEAKKFVLPFLLKFEAECEIDSEDFKSKLQKIVQQTPEEVLEYRTKDISGPPHDRTFTVCVFLNSNLLGKGVGRSKREAEQHAAKEALARLGE